MSVRISEMVGYLVKRGTVTRKLEMQKCCKSRILSILPHYCKSSTRWISPSSWPYCLWPSFRGILSQPFYNAIKVTTCVLFTKFLPGSLVSRSCLVPSNHFLGTWMCCLARFTLLLSLPLLLTNSTHAMNQVSFCFYFTFWGQLNEVYIWYYEGSTTKI